MTRSKHDQAVRDHTPMFQRAIDAGKLFVVYVEAACFIWPGPSSFYATLPDAKAERDRVVENERHPCAGAYIKQYTGSIPAGADAAAAENWAFVEGSRRQGKLDLNATDEDQKPGRRRR